MRDFHTNALTKFGKFCRIYDFWKTFFLLWYDFTSMKINFKKFSLVTQLANPLRFFVFWQVFLISILEIS